MELGPDRLGAELLARSAKERLEGALVWKGPRGVVRVRFLAGRPVEVSLGDSGSDAARDKVVQAVRAMAIATEGTLEAARGGPSAGPSGGSSSSTVDTLGEAWVALTTLLPPPAAAAYVAAHAESPVVATALFDKLAGLAGQRLGAALSRPAPGRRLRELVPAAGEAQRVLAALLALGALELAPDGKAITASPSGAAPPPAEPVRADPILAAARRDIDEAHARLMSADYYAVLGVTRASGPDDVRKAYFQLAKKWHSDSFAGLELGPARAKVEDIFRRISEAQRILGDAKERAAYETLLERERAGLPTDAGVILEAESLFKRGQGMVRRGLAAGALPLLEQAVKLNKGEPEFWIYYGYALYGVRGKEALAEAEKHIQHGLAMKRDIDIAYEFLGRICRVEERYDEATRYLKKALELNPKNKDAERELRVIGLRANKKPGSDGPKSLGELFGNLLKKK